MKLDNTILKAIETRDYNFIYSLEERIKSGEIKINLFNSPINVEIWYDCFLAFERDSLYFSIEGKTTNGKYFNIKSSDAIAKHISIFI